VTDLSKKTTGPTCLRDKMDLLDYCKKVSLCPFYRVAARAKEKPHEKLLFPLHFAYGKLLSCCLPRADCAYAMWSSMGATAKCNLMAWLTLQKLQDGAGETQGNKTNKSKAATNRGKGRAGSEH